MFESWKAFGFHRILNLNRAVLKSHILLAELVYLVVLKQKE